RCEIAQCVRHETGKDVRIEVVQRILEFQIGGYQVVTRACHFAFPSCVTLNAEGLQHPERVGQITEAFLKEQITAGAGMRFRTDAAVADGKLEGRTDREHEFVARDRDEYAFPGEAQVGESTSGR